MKIYKIHETEMTIKTKRGDKKYTRNWLTLPRTIMELHGLKGGNGFIFIINKEDMLHDRLTIQLIK